MMLNIKEQLEEIYNYYKETYREMSKLEFVASETFGLTTYDSSLLRFPIMPAKKISRLLSLKRLL